MRVIIPKDVPGMYWVISVKRKTKRYGNLIINLCYCQRYNVDLYNKTCDCKGFYFGRRRKRNGKKNCRHLIETENLIPVPYPAYGLIREVREDVQDICRITRFKHGP